MAKSEIADTLHMIETEFALSESVYRGTDRGDAILILALVFSGIVAFNLWLLRHLRCLYAQSPHRARLPNKVRSRQRTRANILRGGHDRSEFMVGAFAVSVASIKFKNS